MSLLISYPFLVKGTVHVDAARARIVAQNAVSIPVRAFHAEHGKLTRGRVVFFAAIERGDEAVAVNVHVGVAEGDVVAVCVSRAQVRAVVDDKGLLIAVRVDDRNDVDDVAVEKPLDIRVVRAERQPPRSVHGRRGAFPFAAVDVGKHADSRLFLRRNLLVGDLQTPEVPLLPGRADGIELRDIRVLLRHCGQLRFQLCKGVALVPVDVESVRNLAGCVRSGGQLESFRLFAACRAVYTASGKSKHHHQRKAEAKKLFREGFHVEVSFQSGLKLAAAACVRHNSVLLYFATVLSR